MPPTSTTSRSSWANGHANGLKPVGNFIVDQKWKDGQLLSASVTSVVGGPLAVQYGEEKATIDCTHPGETYTFCLNDGKLTYNLANATAHNAALTIDDAQHGKTTLQTVEKVAADVLRNAGSAK